MPYDYDPGPLPITNRLFTPTYGEMQRYGRSGAGYQRLGAGLGSLFLGGPQRELNQERAFEQAALNQGRLEDVLQQARQRRDSNIASAAAAQRHRDAAAAATDPRVAQRENDLADLFSMNKVNPSELGNFFVSAGKQDAQGAVAKILADPNLSTAQKLEAMQPGLAAEHGQPLTHLTAVEGQNVISPMLLPTSQTPTTTEQGQAAIGEKKAQAAHAMAGAGAENALRDFRTGPQTRAENALTTQRRAEAAKAMNAPAEKTAEKFNEPTMVSLFGGQPDETGKVHLDPIKLQRFEATREALRQSGDSAWNNDAHVLEVQKAKDLEDAGAAASSGPPAELAPPEEGTNLANFFAPAAAVAAIAPAPAQPTDAEGRGLSDAAVKAKRKVLRTGVDKKTGTPVVQYDDGSIEAAGAP